MRKLLKAIRDRRKRTQEIERELKKELRAGNWRVKRTAVLQRRAEKTKSEADLRKFRESRELVRQQRGKVSRLRKMLAQSRAKLESWRRKARKAQARGYGGAVRAAGRHVGKVEAGYNDAGWLRVMERDLLRAGAGLGWMIPGQPYCGFGCDWAWLVGRKRRLPDGVVYTPNICPWRGDIGQVKVRRIAPENARADDLVVMNFGSGGAKHVALARGPMKRGVMPTREYNTSPSNAGSQGNGGGCWDRWRSRGLILCVQRVEPA